jgi:hypothetical protein
MLRLRYLWDRVQRPIRLGIGWTRVVHTEVARRKITALAENLTTTVQPLTSHQIYVIGLWP